MPIPQSLLDKIQQFDDNIQSYKAVSYNETTVRHDFIDPMFNALEWDVNNTQGYAEAYREVIHEDAIKIEGKSKAPDYCFRIGGMRKFFVEAKKPAVNVKDSIDPAFQLRRYAWSAKLPLSVLTDFEEFAVYDCLIPPDKNDLPGKARIFYCNYKQLPEHWDFIAGIFSKTAILKGAFDRYADDKKAKRGTAEVDAAFLAEIETWRNALAQNIAKRNAALSVRELNYAVQLIIDRIIFLRICEDRGIEEYGKLQGLLQGKNVYARLLHQFRDADERYDSGLFHFQMEKGRSADTFDTLTPTLAVDDAELKTILGSLYYPAPYAFDVFPADILGQVYERFLGKVIVLDSKHRATVEEKPEVKKAGGVYYTPTYIVDYIVERTVGKALESKTPKTAASLKICDPACGSGSFLLGAYARLLDWHLQRYIEDGADKHAQGKNPTLYRSGLDEWRLTTAERRRILLNNLYGVDIDPQAVDVTKLSLLLKMLEGGTKETVHGQASLSIGRVLPDLDGNIKCGNSLIAPDFYANRDMTLFDEEEMFRVNVFDWNKAFPHVFKGDNAGFDCVIGNPPYVRIQTLKEFAPKEVEFYKTAYRSAGKGNYDLYVVFAEKGFQLLKSDGNLGFIMPSKFLTTDYGAALRQLLADSNAVNLIVDFGHDLVFNGVSTYTCLLFLQKQKPISEKPRYVKSTPHDLPFAAEKARPISFDEQRSDAWIFADEKGNDLLKRMTSDSIPMLALPAEISRGSSTGADDIFCLTWLHDDMFRTKAGDEVQLEQTALRPALYASDFGRYTPLKTTKNFVIFPYTVSDSGYELLSENAFRNNFPKTYDYLLANKAKLSLRKGTKHWYAFSAARNLHSHDKANFMMPLLANRGLLTVHQPSQENVCVMASAGFSISLLPSSSDRHPFFVLALLNSKLLFWHLQLISNTFRGGWITCTKQYVGTLPIHRVSTPDERKQHDDIVALIERMLELTAKLAAATPATRAVLKSQVELTDRAIDQAVYALYGLTDDEIALVEAATTLTANAN